jgi:hypothetical protein
MNLLFLKLDNLSLVIIPDTQAHLNGHAVITYTYSLFTDNGENNPALMQSRESKLHLDCSKDPDYYGTITFELPDKLFNYTPGRLKKLDNDQVEQAIEFLSDVRNNPNLWKNIEF